MNKRKKKRRRRRRTKRIRERSQRNGQMYGCIIGLIKSVLPLSGHFVPLCFSLCNARFYGLFVVSFCFVLLGFFFFLKGDRSSDI